MTTYEKLTVNLIEKASKALRSAAEPTGDTETDTVNRALQVYDYIMQLQARGGASLVQDEDGNVAKLSIL